MIEKALEKLAELSNRFGDALESLPKSIDDLFVWVTTGSIPERKQCDCDEEAEFCKKLHKIQMTGVCKREA